MSYYYIEQETTIPVVSSFLAHWEVIICVVPIMFMLYLLLSTYTLHCLAQTLENNTEETEEG